MATVNDVAHVAGVSTATVSRVVNGYKHVRPEVRERVRQAIKETGYRRNKVASSLRGHHSNVVGVLVRQQRTPYSSELAYSIESTLHQHQYQTFVCSLEDDLEKQDRYIEMLLESQVRGVIFRPTRMIDHSTEGILKLRENGVGVVTVDIAVPAVNTSQVVSDNIGGGQSGVEYLFSLGHRRVGVVASRLDEDPSLQLPGSLRIRGILKACASLEGRLDPVFVFGDEADQPMNGYQCAKQLLRTNPEVTAVFAVTDLLAIGVLKAAHELGIRVPERLSVLGYDGIPVSGLVAPGLSTIAQPIQKVGETAALTLLEHLKDPDGPNRTTILENRLLVRGTTSEPATGDRVPTL